MTAVPVTVEHLDDLCALWADERVTATLGGPRSADNVELIVSFYEQEWRDRGYGEWAWSDRVTGAFIGRAGLRVVRVDDVEEVEVGYALVAERWGEGLATEATHELVRVAFEVVGLPDVVAFTTPTNLASQRVMRKSGFVYEKDIVWADLDHVLYRRTPR